MTNSRSFKLKIVLPDRCIEENVEGLIIQKSDGFKGFLPDHIDYMAKIENGILTYYRGKEEFFIATGNGYFRFQNNLALVLSTIAERSNDIKILAFKTQERQLKEDQIAQKAHRTFEAAKIALMKALIQKGDPVL